MSRSKEVTTLYHFVPEAALAERVAKWLQDLRAPEIGANPYLLQDLGDVRSANLAAVRRFATVATPIVRAWWKGPAASIPDYWRETNAAVLHIRSKLDSDGAVNFKVMDEAALVRWCVKLGLWPEGMSEEGDGVLQLLGEGVRYGFKPNPHQTGR